MPQFRTLTLLAACALSAAACTDVPGLDEKLAPELRDAPYPELLPLETALAPLPAPDAQAAEIDAGLKARAARLQARADRLRNAEL